ncbi:MAG: response regulator, partial [Ardenticatenaceae bacterium]
MKILVIDDEPDICEVITISFNLRWPEATVLSVGTARKALEACRKESPDVIILDIGLPDADGFDLCKQLREITESPVLILTARNSEIDKVRGLELGADDYITKP